MSFCQSNRGDNPLNKVFVKKNHKKFLEKNWGKIPRLEWVGIFITMNIIIKDEQIINFLRRRFSYDDLIWIINDVQEMIDEGESVDTAVYDGIREFIKSKKFHDIDEFGDDQTYWDSYLKYEKPLVSYVKMKLGLE